MQLRKDVRGGRIDADHLLDLLISSQRQLQEMRQLLDKANQRIAELEQKLGGEITKKVDEPFSVREEEKRQEKRGKKRRKTRGSKRRGRVATADKIARAARTEQVYPTGVPKEDCKLSHTRPVWRLENTI